eukprot:2934915-Pleurochrysis_carterae.AAC.1
MGTRCEDGMGSRDKTTREESRSEEKGTAGKQQSCDGRYLNWVGMKPTAVNIDFSRSGQKTVN